MKDWKIEDSNKLYGIENWSHQYFGINELGNLNVFPKQNRTQGIDLKVIVEEVKKRGFGMPTLFRFPDIIRHRVMTLNETFRKCISELGYKGRYQGVYPIKANQLREVVEEIIDSGKPYDFGLEAGSKGELAAIIAMNLTPESLIIGNGYKDYDFIKTALTGVKLGKKVILIIEKLSELFQIIAIGKEMGVKPLIGVRSKLYSRGSGKWESSGGENAKFGLTTPELLHVVQVLKQEGLEENFKLLHFHIGTQITDINAVKNATKEAARIYAKLRKMGVELDYVDVGGGLGVDYDGSRTTFDSSMNYSLAEYAGDIVYSIQEVCEAEQVPEPNIVTESGRALVAYHSVLVVNVFGSIEVGSTPQPMEETDDEHSVVKELRYLAQNLSAENLLEHYHDAIQRKEEALSMFKLGIFSLEDRAKAEYLYSKICHEIYNRSLELKNEQITDELEGLKKLMADQYLCNFSVFQSLPDSWAVEQLFPIVPIHRHLEVPTRDCILGDVTCDSDGKVCKFIDLKDVNETLKLHALKPNEPYYLGIFLTGAYQDIMGDLHNLFGRVNEVHVFADETEPNGYYIEEMIPGNTIADVLSWIQYHTNHLELRFKEQIEQRVREGLLKPKEGFELQKFYEDVLKGYTYMNVERESTRSELSQAGVSRVKLVSC